MPSKIEWTDETWNPVTGCTKVSAGCANCYAERMSRRLAGRYGYPEAPRHFDVTLHPERLEQPLRWRKPRKVFVCSMSDLFHIDVPGEFLVKVFAVMALCPQHTFQVLTKRPREMLTFLESKRNEIEYVWLVNALRRDISLESRSLEWPIRNVWLLVSIENQATADERVPLLLQTLAAVRGVSAEPLLGAVDLKHWLGWWNSEEGPRSPGQHGHPGDISWLIAGGESGPGARPMHPDWARSLVQQCQAARVPVFVKQMGTYWAKYAEPNGDWHSTVKQRGDTKGHDMKYWPEDLQVREMPEV